MACDCESFKAGVVRDNLKWIILGALILLAIVVLIILLFMLNPNSKYKAYQRQGLDMHNKYRSRHHSVPLKMNEKLTKIAEECAQLYVSQGPMNDWCPKKDKYDGENREFYYEELGETEAVTKTMEKWYSQESKYNYEIGAYNHATNFFAQMVWNLSTEFGIGYASGPSPNGRPITAVVCIYYPFGLREGISFLENVKKP